MQYLKHVTVIVHNIVALTLQQYQKNRPIKLTFDMLVSRLEY